MDLLSFSFLMKVCLVVSLWCNGLYINTGYGDILHKPAQWVQKLPAWICKPTLGCISCMASFHSLLILVVFFWFKGISFSYLLQSWVPVTIISSFLNAFIYLAYSCFEGTYYELSKKRRQDESGI